MNGSIDTVTTNYSPPNHIKPRRKPAKSCAFCRKRKLKCDLKRPICSSCKSRTLANCIYPDNAHVVSALTTNTDNTKGISKMTNENSTLQLMKKVDQLERQIDEIAKTSPPISSISNHTSPQGSIPATTPSNITINSPELTLISSNANAHDGTVKDTHCNITNIKKNPLRDFYYLQSKESGRRIIYGPTSLRTNLEKHRFGFGQKFRQLWDKIKYERIRWKEEHKTSVLREAQLIEDAYDKNYDNLLENVCKDLPSYEKCLELIHSFFDPTFKDLYTMRMCLDRTKVLSDFYNGFIPDDKNLLPNGEKSIKQLMPSVKKNYYRIGVILMILAINHYYQYLPMSIEHFIHFLTGNMTSKVFYVERAQFLVLRCDYSRTYVADCDDSHIINLASLTTTAATMLGLDQNIEDLYKSQENIVGSVQSLRNMWYVILYLDFEVAFQIGKPLQFQEIDLDYDEDSTILLDEHLIKLRKFLRLGRGIMKCLLARRGVPNLEKITNDIFEFMESELPPISHFIDSDLLAQVNLHDVRIASICIELILVMNTLRFAVNRELSIELSVVSMHMNIISFAMLNAVTDRCFKIDKEYFPDLFSDSNQNITPYVAHSINITAGLVPRSTTIFASIVYFRVTRFSSNELLFSKEYKNKFNPTMLRLKGDANEYSIIEALRIYEKYTNQWLDPKDSIRRKIMAKSYYFVIGVALQRVFKTLLNQCLEYRQKAEGSWLTQLESDIGMTPLREPRSPQRNLSVQELIHTAPPITNTDRNKTINNDGISVEQTNPIQAAGLSQNQPHESTDPEGKIIFPSTATYPSNEKECEMLQLLADEFWANYNIGWDELLDQTTAEDLFNIM